MQLCFSCIFGKKDDLHIFSATIFHQALIFFISYSCFVVLTVTFSTILNYAGKT